MRPNDFSPMIKLMSEVGQQIVQWQSNKVLRHIYSEVEFKTEADQRAHEKICQGINILYPGSIVLSEENDAPILKRPDAYWLIDPIDGTSSWFHGFAGFVTQAAYLEDGKPIFGIIHAPLLRKTWTAINRMGAYLNGVRLPTLIASNRLVITDNTPEPHGIAKYFFEHFQATGYCESGSLGLKAVLVADGTADLFIKNVVVRDWDFAPVSLIIQEVGGQFGLANGKAYKFTGAMEKHSGVVVARDLILFRRAIELFSQYERFVTAHE
jgi:3'(2'), 5'-bisphosphate nucleotidase